MEMTSRSDRGFTDEDDEDEEFARRDGASNRRESSAKVDGRNNGEKKAISPRSKHSATEQRRRSKINDRFRILRDLIPHTDQKRDKASFLLEVIEYIEFLHEKVQKYETTFPGWINDNSKLMPWKVPQMAMKTVTDPSQLMQNGQSSSYLVSGDNASTAATMLTNCPASLNPENVTPGVENKETFSGLLHHYTSDVGFTHSPHTIISNPENMAPHPHSQWLRPCNSSPVYMLNNQDMAVDDGTINISSPYSQGLLQALAQTLQDCGIDLSQASISVQINLGKRSFCGQDSNNKDHIEDTSAANQDIGFTQMRTTVEETEQISKKLKPDNS